MPFSQPISRAVAWCVLVAYVLVVSGVGIPVVEPPPGNGSAAAARLADKDRGRPFPCMDKPCGCATAEQCFSSCCCNSPAELLAWAEAHRLDPATLLALQARVADASPAPAAAACCSAAHESPACCSASDERSGDVCDEYRSLAAEPAPPATTTASHGDDDARDAAPVRLISLRAMLACGGILAGWSAATISLPPPPAVRCTPALPLVAMLDVVDDASFSVVMLLDTPPPRA
jgi:hypothetical protein